MKIIFVFLQTPIDVVCPGRKDTKPVPMIPDTFYYRVEIVDTSRDQTTYEDVSRPFPASTLKCGSF